MLDFTSALYLGFEHPSWSLPAWPRLTLGKPAALEEFPEAAQLERELAALAGCEGAVLGPSTLHLFWDLFGFLARPQMEILVSEDSYPIAGWGAARAALSGIPVRTFAGHNGGGLAAATGGARKPVIVTDGFCPACGKAAPLAEYADHAKARDGLIVVDDSQAFGVLGESGGGSLRRIGANRDRVIVVNSLAKAFGVPVAMLAGPERFVKRFRASSATRVHCSPPSAAVLCAARNALEQNRRFGRCLRAALTARVVRFCEGLRRLGLMSGSTLFPMQRLRLPPGCNPFAVYERLLELGIRTVLHRSSSDGRPQIGFIVTARHNLKDIDEAITALASAVGGEYAQASSSKNLCAVSFNSAAPPDGKQACRRSIHGHPLAVV